MLKATMIFQQQNKIDRTNETKQKLKTNLKLSVAMLSKNTIQKASLNMGLTDISAHYKHQQEYSGRLLKVLNSQFQGSDWECLPLLSQEYHLSACALLILHIQMTLLFHEVLRCPSNMCKKADLKKSQKVQVNQRTERLKGCACFLDQATSEVVLTSYTVNQS